MASRLSNKERGFVKDYLKTGNGTLAIKQNYDVKNDNTAAALASEYLRKPKIQTLVDEAFPDDELYKLHREGLYDEDLIVRHKYLESAYKLKGSYAPDKSVNVNIETHQISPAMLELAKKLDEQRNSKGSIGS